MTSQAGSSGTNSERTQPPEDARAEDGAQHGAAPGAPGREQRAGASNAWATLGGGARRSGPGQEHVKGCRCCFPPDQMFEDACCAIVALNLQGIGAMQAEKFVRLCGGGVGTMTLSKGKHKTALKLRKGIPLSSEDVDAMQACVLEAYRPALEQLGMGEIEPPAYGLVDS
eukprot:Tamp_26118.p1 GENE.Tamp_26118~~Tamp_26118.p1  ORF type:complete len:170 (+),score=26.97 Tamp_26118:184-693(+)